MDRRSFVQTALLGLPAAIAPGLWQMAAAQGIGFEDLLSDSSPHSFDRVVAWARRLASEPHRPAEATLAPPFADLEAAEFAGITPDPEWRIDLGAAPPIAIEPLPPGFVYTTPVRLALVTKTGEAEPVAFSPSFFRFDPALFPEPAVPADPPDYAGMGFSGFRVVAPVELPDELDPVAIFQGASQFRARPRDGVWGASARGLAIGTASPVGEEVPVFTHFWLHSTAEGDRALRVHALLDSPSVAGAYAFEIRPGAETSMAVRCRLFPRSEIAEVGIAPLTSMFFFGSDRLGRDDLRDAVHDSDGLQIVTGRGERIWRALANPPGLQISGFADENPRGFGLAQRARSYEHFGDPTAGFERRPSVWVEPIGEWGRGQVVLVEIPLPSEVNDNIVAFWRPAGVLQPGEEYPFDYSVTFAPLPPDAAPLARVAATRSGAAGEDARRFAVEFDRSAAPEGPLTPQLTASRGSVGEVVVLDTPVPDRVRVTFRFAPEGADTSELRMVLAGPDGQPASETWLHRWISA